MPKWFGVRADDRVPREWRTALETVLRPLDQSSKGQAAAARDFVLTGSPASAITNASGPGHYVQVFNLWGGTLGAEGDAAVRTLCQRLADVPPEVAVRLGLVVEASAVHGFALSQPHLRWLEALLVGFANAHTKRAAKKVQLSLDIAVVEGMVHSTGRPAGEALVSAFRGPRTPSYYGHHGYRTAFRSLKGYADAVARHAEALRPTLGSTKVDDRLVVLEMLDGLPGEVLELFAAEIADYATSTSSQVRTATYGPLTACGRAAVEPLKAIARTGRPANRLEALERLYASADPGTGEWAVAAAAEDRAASVRALVDRWTHPGADQTPVEDAVLPAVETPQIDWRTPVTPELTAKLEKLVANTNRDIAQTNEQQRQWAQQWKQQHGTSPSVRPQDLLDRGFLPGLLAALESGKAGKDSGHTVSPHLPSHVARALPGLGLGPAGLTILLARCGLLQQGRWTQLWDGAAAAYDALFQETGRPSMLEVSTMLDELGYDGGTMVLHSYVSSWGFKLGRSWPDDAVAPFMTVHLDKVMHLLKPSAERDYSIDELGVFPALATLPTLPRSVVDGLYASALGSRKTERRPAQDALGKVPDIEERVITALSDGKGDVRALAAQWLGRLRHEPAIPALEAAVGKEKHDVALGAMLDALQAMGQPVGKYLDPVTLADQAAKAVAKGLPKAIDWFPWAGLPTVRWADGEPVPLDTLKWFLAQAVKGKSPEPNAVLRKYCAMFEPRDRETFGQFVLEAWIAQDLIPIDPEEARRQAQSAADGMYQSIQSWPEYYKDSPLLNASPEQILAAYLPGYLKQPAGSASSSKGLLAVAAACAGEGAAPVAQRYLKEWYGQRASQGRALIVMLAWIEHPSATQLMLSVGSRFRTKGFQEEATRQAELLAERKGWTVGELADRTIPTAGFDESGVLELSYGDRVFTAHLMPDLTVELRSPEDKPVKALPAPRQTDDEPAAKEAKKILATAKKELKAVATLQSERLYEALCTERGWTFEDWDRYLRQHPVMRHLTQRLAWTATTGDDLLVFRPLDDGTLTDVDDEPVTVAPDAKVLVAHDSNLVAEQVAAWQAHFADYEVTPLFQQFGKGSFALPEGQSAAQDITDFQGYLVEAFALRGRAGKLGYTRGQTEDAGWFFGYEKRFPTLAITAAVAFSGNYLPEENRTVALKALSFQRNGPNGRGYAMRLAEVPAILLSEAWNDLRVMAADGPGFDADWEKKVEF